MSISTALIIYLGILYSQPINPYTVDVHSGVIVKTQLVYERDREPRVCYLLVAHDPHLLTTVVMNSDKQRFCKYVVKS